MIEPLMVSEMGIGAGMGADVVELVSHAGLVVKMVLMILLFFSIVSWAIIIVKFRAFRAAEKESRSFLDLFWGTRNFSKAYAEAKRLLHSPIATMFKAGYADVEKIRKDLLPAGNPLPQANGEGQRRLAEELASIHAPLGLEIGAQTPDEIAVSILAEMIAVRRGVDPALARSMKMALPGRLSAGRNPDAPSK